MEEDGERHSFVSKLSIRTGISGWLSTRSIGPNRSLQSSSLNLAIQQIETFAPTSVASLNITTRETVDKPDKGYAWVILVCCLLLQMLPCIPMASVGIFYVEFLTTFKYGEGITSWICSLQAALEMISGPAAALLMDRTNARVSALIGCIGTGLSLALASLTHRFEIIFLSYGILAALFLSCVHVPAAVYSVQFFDKYRTLALTLSTCSTPLIYLVVPPLVTFFINTFNWRNANLFLAAICLQGGVLAMLLRPVRKRETSSNNNSSVHVISSETVNPNLNSQHSVLSEDKPELTEEYRDNIIRESDERNDARMSASKTLLSSHNKLNTSHHSSQVLHKSLTELKSSVECKLPDVELCSLQQINMANVEQTKSTHPFLVNLLSLCHWRIAIIIIGHILWGWAASLVIVLLPEQAKIHGIENTETSQLLMIAGAVGFGSRLLYVAIGHFVNCQKVLGIIGGHILISLALLGMIFASEFSHFVTVACLYTSGFGALVCFGGPLILEMHGEENMGMIFGLMMMSYGVGSLVSTPFATYLYIQSGSYLAGFIIGSIGCLLGGLLYFSHVILTFCKRRSQNR